MSGEGPKSQSLFIEKVNSRMMVATGARVVDLAPGHHQMPLSFAQHRTSSVRSIFQSTMIPPYVYTSFILAAVLVLLPAAQATIFRSTPRELWGESDEHGLPAALQRHLQTPQTGGTNITLASIGRLDSDIVPDLAIGFPTFDCVSAADCGGVLLVFLGQGSAAQPDARVQKHVWMSPDNSLGLQTADGAGSLLGSSIVLLGMLLA